MFFMFLVDLSYRLVSFFFNINDYVFFLYSMLAEKAPFTALISWHVFILSSVLKDTFAGRVTVFHSLVLLSFI